VQTSAVVASVATVAIEDVQFGSGNTDFKTPAATDDLQYLSQLAARRRKAIREGRECWTRPDLLAAMRANGIDPGQDEMPA
jgi:hypothetical protein